MANPGDVFPPQQCCFSFFLVCLRTVVYLTQAKTHHYCDQHSLCLHLRSTIGCEPWEVYFMSNTSLTFFCLSAKMIPKHLWLFLQFILFILLGLLFIAVVWWSVMCPAQQRAFLECQSFVEGVTIQTLQMGINPQYPSKRYTSCSSVNDSSKSLTRRIQTWRGLWTNFISCHSVTDCVCNVWSILRSSLCKIVLVGAAFKTHLRNRWL